MVTATRECGVIAFDEQHWFATGVKSPACDKVLHQGFKTANRVESSAQTFWFERPALGLFAYVLAGKPRLGS